METPKGDTTQVTSSAVTNLHQQYPFTLAKAARSRSKKPLNAIHLNQLFETMKANEGNPEARLTRKSEGGRKRKGYDGYEGYSSGNGGTTVKVVAAALLGGLALMGSQKRKGMNGLSPTLNPSTS